jgi:hypothetical protein
MTMTTTVIMMMMTRLIVYFHSSIPSAGKHISETVQAFDFLDNYLSDDDGVDTHSPPKSPVLSGKQ